LSFLSPQPRSAAIRDLPWWAFVYALAIAALGVVTAVSFYRRRAPWLYSVAQLVSTLGLLGFIAGHWNLEVRYALGRAWLLVFLAVLGWESFFLGHRLATVIPRFAGSQELQARTEVVLLVARAAVIAPAMVAGAAFAYRIWF